jgi:hypothetical protein
MNPYDGLLKKVCPQIIQFIFGFSLNHPALGYPIYGPPPWALGAPGIRLHGSLEAAEAEVPQLVEPSIQQATLLKHPHDIKTSTF